MSVPACPRCEREVALHEGQPIVTASGVQLWHAACHALRDVPIAIELPAPIPPAPRVARDHLILGGIAATAILAMGIGHLVWHDAVDEVSEAPNVVVGTSATIPASMVSVRRTARERRPAGSLRLESEIAARYPIPVVDGKSLDETFPSLEHWTHPVSASLELVPTEIDRLFGRPRAGLRQHRSECGEGHCGIDLDGPRGRPIVAVADGRVVRVERRADGGDGLSGRFVKIRHDDGTFTSYMHLDEVGDALVAGERITGGTYVGTLGATATFSAPPHLHFSLELPNHPDPGGPQTDSSDTHHVDPSPFLARSTIVPVPAKIERNAARNF